MPSAASPKSIGAPGAERVVSGEPRLPSSLADLVTSFESAKQKCTHNHFSFDTRLLTTVFELLAMRRDNDLGSIHKILEAGFSNVPQPLDAEK